MCNSRCDTITVSPKVWTPSSLDHFSYWLLILLLWTQIFSWTRIWICSLEWNKQNVVVVNVLCSLWAGSSCAGCLCSELIFQPYHSPHIWGTQTCKNLCRWCQRTRWIGLKSPTVRSQCDVKTQTCFQSHFYVCGRKIKILCESLSRFSFICTKSKML